jgi:hypothetical protein
MPVWLEALQLVVLLAVLYSGKQTVSGLLRDVRAKKALEAEVLRAVKADPQARAAISPAAGHANQAVGAARLVMTAAARLDGADAEAVQRALAQGEQHGRANYIGDITRHVNAELTHSA